MRVCVCVLQAEHKVTDGMEGAGSETPQKDKDADGVASAYELETAQHKAENLRRALFSTLLLSGLVGWRFPHRMLEHPYLCPYLCVMPLAYISCITCIYLSRWKHR